MTKVQCTSARPCALANLGGPQKSAKVTASSRAQGRAVSARVCACARTPAFACVCACSAVAAPASARAVTGRWQWACKGAIWATVQRAARLALCRKFKTDESDHADATDARYHAPWPLEAPRVPSGPLKRAELICLCSYLASQLHLLRQLQRTCAVIAGRQGRRWLLALMKECC